MSNLHKKLAKDKLGEICYCLATYFNYLTIPRKGFFIVGGEENGINIPPVIDYSHIIYLLNEIYPCGEFNYRVVSSTELQTTISGNKKSSVIPNKAKNKIREEIKKHVNPDPSEFIEDPLFRQSLQYTGIDRVKITDEVVNKIYSYYLAYSATLPQDEKSIKELLLSLLRKRSPVNYGLNSDIQNTALQSMIYIITGLVDSLDIKRVGKNEVMTAYKILIPLDLQDTYTLFPAEDENISNILIKVFHSKNLHINNEAVQLLISYINMAQSVSEKVYAYSKNDPKDSNTRVLNRLLGFSTYI